MSSQTILFEDIFDIREINPHGKKFEKVNRIHCRGKIFIQNISLILRIHRVPCHVARISSFLYVNVGTRGDVELIVDINSELLRVKPGERSE